MDFVCTAVATADAIYCCSRAAVKLPIPAATAALLASPLTRLRLDRRAAEPTVPGILLNTPRLLR